MDRMEPNSRWNARRWQAWLPPVDHPIGQLALIAVAARTAGLAWHFFGYNRFGQPLIAMPLVYFPAAAAAHLAVILGFCLAMLLLWRCAGRARGAVVAAAAAVLGAMVLVGQIDFGVQRFSGQHFTPAVAATYLTPRQVVSWVVWQALAAVPGYTLAAVALVAGAWAGLAAVAWRALRCAADPRWDWQALASPALLLGYLASVPFQQSATHRTITRPPEINIAGVLCGFDRTQPPADLSRRLALLRGIPGPRPEAAWLDDRFPLIHKPTPAAPDAGRPDVIMILVESLTAPELGYVAPSKRQQTPNLDALAAQSVEFRSFVASGFPTAPAFFSLMTGTPPHRRKIIPAEFTDRTFDALPPRLRELGYRCITIWGGDVSFGNVLPWCSRWFDEVDCAISPDRIFGPCRRGDAEIVRVLIEKIREHDRANPGQPLFVSLMTAGMHGPFTTANQYFSRPEDAREAAPYAVEALTDTVENYRHMLVLFDRQLPALREFLASRPRRDNTVLFVLGDHATPLDEHADDDIRDFPLDSTVWTTALVQGPERLVGRPRVETFACGEMDFMPTVLRLAGDARPTAAMGGDLLAPIPGSGRSAIAVRAAGYRLDRAGWSLFVAAGDPGRWFARRSFQDGRFTGVSEPGGPFTEADARRLHESVQTWSWLVEQDRVWRPGAESAAPPPP